MKKSVRSLSLLSAVLLAGVAIGGTAPMWTAGLSAQAAEAGAAPAKKKLVANGQLYIMWKKDGAHKETPEEFKTMLEYQAKMERDGSKFIGGALADQAGKRSGGIVIIRAKSWEDAKAICDADPGVKDGSTTYELHAFALNSGAFNVRLDFSDANETQYLAGSPAGK